MRMLAIVTAAVALANIGCARSVPERLMQTGPGQPVVSDAVRAIGGGNYLAYDIHAFALITTYDDGSPCVGSAQMVIALPAQRLTATGPAGKGQWKADVTGSTCRIATKDFPSTPRQRQALCNALQVVLLRFGGPVNFISGRAISTALSDVSVAGELFQRVSVAPNPDAVQAYYFDDRGLLRYVTAGADMPGGEGTITIYQWQKLSENVMVPKSIRVMEVGEFVLIGGQTILEVEFESVQFR